MPVSHSFERLTQKNEMLAAGEIEEEEFSCMQHDRSIGTVLKQLTERGHQQSPRCGRYQLKFKKRFDNLASE